MTDPDTGVPAPDADDGGEETGIDAVVVNADDLFRGAKEIWIEHLGVRYRLRITRRNKLILQK